VRAQVSSGLGSLLLALLSVLGLIALNLDGYHWPDSAEVPFDGRTHAVSLPDSATAMVWVYAPDFTGQCRFVDAQTGTVLPVRRADGDYWRPGGSAGPYAGRFTVQSGSGEVAVRCPRVDGVSPIHVEQAPWLPPLLAQFGSFVLVPAALASAGVLLLVLAIVLAKRRASAS
jgi:hypothetical protein